MLQSFAPIIDSTTRFLVIGTMPSVASLEAQQYYAFKHNAFWKIIAQISGCCLEDYPQKITVLKQLHIGLWDNLQFCERKGSLDSDIRNEVPNDFEHLLEQYPNVEKLLFNGQKSFVFFKKHHPFLLDKYSYAVLPSTSPANARLSFADKLDMWWAAVQ